MSKTPVPGDGKPGAPELVPKARAIPVVVPLHKPPGICAENWDHLTVQWALLGGPPALASHPLLAKLPKTFIY